MEIYIGMEFEYRNKIYKIRHIKKNFDQTVILTGKEHFVLSEKRLIEFKNEIKPVSKTPKQENIKMIKPMENKLTQATKQDKLDIKQVLFDAIQEVKVNKDYVQQANAICNITSQLINIKKLESKL